MQQTVVTAEAPLVETSSSALATLVDDRVIRDLPLNGRSFDQLLTLNAAAPQVRLRGRAVSPGSTEMYSVAGARTQSNLFIMDGIELVGAGDVN